MEITQKMDAKKIYGTVLEELIGEGLPIAVVDPDLMRIAGTDALPKKYPERYVQVGIAEQNAMGVAAGFACMGKTVFLSAFCGFLGSRSNDQALNTVCYNALNVKLVGTYAGLTSGINGGTHISIQDIAAFRGMPGMRVVDPLDGPEIISAMRCAAETPGPVFIRLGKGPFPTVFGEDHAFQWGKAVRMTESGSVALITSGVTTGDAIDAVAMLAEQGIRVLHLHMPSIKPIDAEAIRAAAGCGLIVTAENHSVVGGLGSAVCEVAAALEKPPRVVRLGVQDVFAEGIAETELKKRHGIDAGGICATIAGLVK